MKFYFVISLLLSLAVITTNDPYDFDVIEDTSSDHRGAVRMRDGMRSDTNTFYRNRP